MLIKKAVFSACIEFRKRQNRESHPSGNFDKAGRWFPNDAEESLCCKSISSPTRAYPFSLNSHCRTAKHVANLYAITTREMSVFFRDNEELFNILLKKENKDFLHKVISILPEAEETFELDDIYVILFKKAI